jgi:hypothetical protein
MYASLCSWGWLVHLLDLNIQAASLYLVQGCRHVHHCIMDTRVMHPACACRFKTKALAGLEMGTENRVAMLFPGPEPFWPADPHFMRPLTG